MHSPFTTVVESGTSAMTTTTPSLYPPLPLAMTTAGAAVTQSLARALTVVTTALAGVHMTTRSISWGVAATTNAAATSHTVPSTSTAQKYKELIDNPVAQNTEFALKHRECVLAAMAVPLGLLN